MSSVYAGTRSYQQEQVQLILDECSRREAALVYPGFCLALDCLSEASVDGALKRLTGRLANPSREAVKGVLHQGEQGFLIPQDVYFILPSAVARHLMTLDPLGRDLEARVNRQLPVHAGYSQSLRVLWHAEETFKTLQGTCVLRFVFHVPGYARPADRLTRSEREYLLAGLCGTMLSLASLDADVRKPDAPASSSTDSAKSVKPEVARSKARFRQPITQALQVLELADEGQLITRTYLQDVVKPAYRQLIKRHHPDCNADTQAASERTRRINAAYQSLRGCLKPASR